VRFFKSTFVAKCCFSLSSGVCCLVAVWNTLV
jgi:hypothetical protein